MYFYGKGKNQGEDGGEAINTAQGDSKIILNEIVVIGFFVLQFKLSFKYRKIFDWAWLVKLVRHLYFYRGF